LVVPHWSSQLEGPANAQYGVNNCLFMQDGTSMRTSMLTIEAIGPYLNIPPRWPPNSPDLNPIEMLWAIIGRRLAGKDFHTEKELGDEVTQASIDGLVESFRSRLELCLACTDASISQLLSSYRIGPRPQYIVDVDDFPALTAEVDAEIREWAGSHGNKWTKLRGHLKSGAMLWAASRRSCSGTAGISSRSRTATWSSRATVWQT
jgi:hypothetical protein